MRDGDPLNIDEDLGAVSSTQPTPVLLKEFTRLQVDFKRFVLRYQFAVEEVTTKISILRQEFRLLHDYNPIEHVSTRVKTAESIVDKVVRKGCEPSFGSIRETITDIAGVRVTCSFTSDVYRLFEMLTRQSDVTLLHVKDYIADPKPNGYRSLHALVEVPVFLSDGVEPVVVELQFRTIAMDFWATLEHKIYYKYKGSPPDGVLDHLIDAAETAHRLDDLMEDLHHQVRATAVLSEADTSDDRFAPADDVLAHFLKMRDARD